MSAGSDTYAEAESALLFIYGSGRTMYFGTEHYGTDEEGLDAAGRLLQRRGLIQFSDWELRDQGDFLGYLTEAGQRFASKLAKQLNYADVNAPRPRCNGETLRALGRPKPYAPAVARPTGIDSAPVSSPSPPPPAAPEPAIIKRLPATATPQSAQYPRSMTRAEWAAATAQSAPDGVRATAMAKERREEENRERAEAERRGAEEEAIRKREPYILAGVAFIVCAGAFVVSKMNGWI